MIPKSCKRLAEMDFPIAEVSRHAARENSTPSAHPSGLHLWWARRPLASSRTGLLCIDERCVVKGRRDCFCCCVITDRDNAPRLQEPIRNPTRLDWNEVRKVAHYYLSVNGMAKPRQVGTDPPLSRNES
jgi:hypothetical protein